LHQTSEWIPSVEAIEVHHGRQSAAGCQFEDGTSIIDATKYGRPIKIPVGALEEF
jgi:hypothetical protein